ncbi:MAG TPA: GIY-YIG nuclease family protein [Rhodanobacteraceae bacterium]|nr:GIY-YIG nuclease family protein [Rhodanobacteraceae bacterium]
MLDRHPCVYILASKERGTLYVGVTSDLIKRIWEHKNDLVDGFTRKYRVHHLVWYEQHETIDAAIAREKAIKEWKRAWKLELIEAQNPSWNDLYQELSGQAEEQDGFRLSPE